VQTIVVDEQHNLQVHSQYKHVNTQSKHTTEKAAWRSVCYRS